MLKTKLKRTILRKFSGYCMVAFLNETLIVTAPVSRWLKKKGRKKKMNNSVFRTFRFRQSSFAQYIHDPIWSHTILVASYTVYGIENVAINGANSSTLPVLSGVPQGSILGPLLFIIYVNDLPVSINRAACYLFANDTKLLKSISSPIDTVSLQDDIIAVEAWCRKWNLSLNSSKCCAIRFTLGECDNGTYILNNTPIKFTNLRRDLQVYTN